MLMLMGYGNMFPHKGAIHKVSKQQTWTQGVVPGVRAQQCLAGVRASLICQKIFQTDLEILELRKRH
jgi:hypothetical protein